ncbi:MAG: hypothetical protein ABI675_15035 [Chitinophagaceae bacterium]
MRIKTIHIGKLIKAEVKKKKLTQKEFGALIKKSEKTVPNIYTRASITTDLLITISEALKIDFLRFYLNTEPMINLRDDEAGKLYIQILHDEEKINRLKRELALTENLIEAQKETIFLLKEQIENSKSIKNSGSLSSE